MDRFNSPRFPTTRWTMLAAVRGEITPEHRDVLNWLITRYWPPVHHFICRRGYASEASDLTQEFFLQWWQRDLFSRADKERGRFRTFLLACLTNFLNDAHRRRHRSEATGIVTVHQLTSDSHYAIEPVNDETPDAVFDRMWATNLLQITYCRLEEEMTSAGQHTHLELFRARIWEPLFKHAEPLSLRQLADRLGLEEKQAANQLVTARRAFQRLTREEIRNYAADDDEVAAEVLDLFRIVGT